MGFLGLVPASQLAATYDPNVRALTLFAKGITKKYTASIRFQRDPHWVGGLKFDLEGWIGPLGEGPKPYEREGNFAFGLPSKDYPSGDVIIATANNPEGKVVPIHWLGAGGEKSASTPSAGSLSVSAKKTTQPPVTVHPTHPMVVVFGEPFHITAGDEPNKYGSVTLKRDEQFLHMTDAKNQGGQIIWTFVAVAIGMAQAIVTSVFPPPAIGTSQLVHNIEVIGRNVSELPHTITHGTGEIPLSFLGRVFLADRIVKSGWPDAELYEVQCNLPKGVINPTSNPMDLSQLKEVWWVPNGTVIITSNGWGSWNKPEFIDQPWLEDRIIPFPISLDIIDACKKMRTAGYTELFFNCTLRHPLGPGGQPYDSQPYYIFELAGSGKYIFVGVDDGSVWPPKSK